MSDLALGVCGATEQDYLTALEDLLPRGWAWAREPGSLRARLLAAFAALLLGHHARNCDLLAESFPCGATELLEDWERVLALPDPCMPAGRTVGERQAAVCAKIAGLGAQTKAWFVALAASVGFAIEIEEHFPARLGQARMGCFALGACQNVWTVRVLGQQLAHWQVGCASVCDPLCKSPDLSALICVIDRTKPAHTSVNYLVEE